MMYEGVMISNDADFCICERLQNAAYQKFGGHLTVLLYSRNIRLVVITVTYPYNSIKGIWHENRAI